MKVTKALPATLTHKKRKASYDPATGTLCVADTRTVETYRVEEFRIDEEFTGRAFRLTKPDGVVYSTRVGTLEGDHDCDCPGHVYKGSCKHQTAIRTFLEAGQL